MKEIKNKNEYHRYKYLDNKNPNSSRKSYYTENVFKELKKHYDSK